MLIKIHCCNINIHKYKLKSRVDIQKIMIILNELFVNVEFLNVKFLNNF